MEQTHDDIDQWLADLANDQGAGAPHSESQLLRKVILSQAMQQEDEMLTGALSQEHALNALLFRLRRERLVTSSAKAPWAFALAASLAAITVGVLVLLQPEGQDQMNHIEPPIWRGAYAQYEVQTPQARKAAEQMADILRKNGIQADIYTLGYVYTVDAEIVLPIPPPVTLLFKEYALKVEAGRVRINFKP